MANYYDYVTGPDYRTDFMVSFMINIQKDAHCEYPRSIFSFEDSQGNSRFALQLMGPKTVKLKFGFGEIGLDLPTSYGSKFTFF